MTSNFFFLIFFPPNFSSNFIKKWVVPRYVEGKRERKLFHTLAQHETWEKMMKRKIEAKVSFSSHVLIGGVILSIDLSLRRV